MSLYTKYQSFHFLWNKLKTKYWYALFLKKCGIGNIIFKPLFLTPQCVIVENQVSIWANARIEGIFQYQQIKFNPNIIIQDNVSIQQNLHLTCANSVEIGKDTAIGANVTITDIHHTYTDIKIAIEKQAIQTNPVVIGEACKIYNNSVILPGTHIGKHCTIGANSVVSGAFPDYCILVGAPAKIVKRYSFEKEAWLKTNAKGEFLEQ